MLKITFWTSQSGKKPVLEWLEEIDQPTFKRLDFLIELLRKMGPDLKMPYARYLGQELWELRERGSGCRIYYSIFDGELALLLVSGSKDTQVRDIEMARKRLYEEKKNEKK